MKLGRGRQSAGPQPLQRTARTAPPSTTNKSRCFLAGKWLGLTEAAWQAVALEVPVLGEYLLCKAKEGTDTPKEEAAKAAGGVLCWSFILGKTGGSRVLVGSGAATLEN